MVPSHASPLYLVPATEHVSEPPALHIITNSLFLIPSPSREGALFIGATAPTRINPTYNLTEFRAQTHSTTSCPACRPSRSALPTLSYFQKPISFAQRPQSTPSRAFLDLDCLPSGCFYCFHYGPTSLRYCLYCVTDRASEEVRPCPCPPIPALSLLTRGEPAARLTTRFLRARWQPRFTPVRRRAGGPVRVHVRSPASYR